MQGWEAGVALTRGAALTLEARRGLGERKSRWPWGPAQRAAARWEGIPGHGTNPTEPLPSPPQDGRGREKQGESGKLTDQRELGRHEDKM